jgi:hypothetical protein
MIYRWMGWRRIETLILCVSRRRAFNIFAAPIAVTVQRSGRRAMMTAPAVSHSLASSDSLVEAGDCDIDPFHLFHWKLLHHSILLPRRFTLSLGLRARPAWSKAATIGAIAMAVGDDDYR